MNKYIKVIIWIDAATSDEPFAMHELRRDVLIDRSSAYAIFKRLENMEYLKKLSKGYKYKVWLVTSKWNTPTQVIKHYELYMTLRLSARELP